MKISMIFLDDINSEQFGKFPYSVLTTVLNTTSINIIKLIIIYLYCKLFSNYMLL